MLFYQLHLPLTPWLRLRAAWFNAEYCQWRDWSMAMSLDYRHLYGNWTDRVGSYEESSLWRSGFNVHSEYCLLRLKQGHREFPFWNWKIPPPRSAKNSRKFPLSIKLNYHSLCNTSTLYMVCIPYVVFMGRDVGCCVLSVLPLFSLVLILITVNLWSYLCV